MKDKETLEQLHENCRHKSNLFSCQPAQTSSQSFLYYAFEFSSLWNFLLFALAPPSNLYQTCSTFAGMIFQDSMHQKKQTNYFIPRSFLHLFFFCDSSSRRYIPGFPLLIGHLRKNQVKWKHFKLYIFHFPWIFQGMFVLPCWMTIKNHIYSIYSMLPAFLVVIETLEIDSFNYK